MKETPSQLNVPSYLMNFPFTLDTSNPNNIWMKELSPEEIKVDKNKAYRQFLDLYNFVAGSGLCYLLPSEGNFPIVLILDPSPMTISIVDPFLTTFNASILFYIFGFFLYYSTKVK